MSRVKIDSHEHWVYSIGHLYGGEVEVESEDVERWTAAMDAFWQAQEEMGAAIARSARAELAARRAT